MPPTIWQRLILAFCVLTCAHIGLDIAGSFRTGDLGAVVTVASDHRHYTVDKVTNPAGFDGTIKPGDVFTFQDSSLDERIRYTQARAGDRYVLVLADGRHVRATIMYSPPNAVDFVYFILRIAMVLMAVFIAVRRPELSEARALANFLAVFGFAIMIEPQPFFPTWLAGIFPFIQQTALLLALTLALQLATIFPDPEAGGVRRIVRIINPYVFALFVVVVNVGIAMSTFALETPPEFLRWIAGAANVFYLVAITTAFWLANRHATPAEKSRVRWISFSFAIGFTGVVAQLAFVLAGAVTWVVGLFGLTLLAIPFGLAYAIVRHRVIDVGFAINRALVFGVLSALVVGAFGALEWFLGKVVVERGHITSATIEVLLALALGASMRTIHARVERVADDLFFRDRHRAEAALRRFTSDVPYITDLSTIYQRTIDEVCRHAESADAALYLFDEDRYIRVAGGEAMPSDVSANDPLFVRLRATREVVGVHDTDCAIDAELACPFLVRGQIAGALVCTAKTNGEAYAPDERAILGELARTVGITTDALYTDALRREVERLLGEKPTLALARDLLARTATGGSPRAV